MNRSCPPSRSFLAALTVLLLTVFTAATAFAAGSLTYKKKEIQESNGGWHLTMTIVYGPSAPAMQHIPMKFKFTPTAFYERYLDDQHGEKPQLRKIPLVGQVPLTESVDVNFGDVRGKIFNRTMFDFTITRSHNFNAGEYSVSVHRADGTPVGGPQTLTLLGENPVIDRRAISFVASGKDKDKKPAAQDGAQNAAADTKPAAGQGAQGAGEAEEETAAPAAPAGSAERGEGAPPDSANAEKVPPSSRGCGCRVATREHLPASGLLFGVALGILGVRRRRQASGAGDSSERR